MKFLRNLMEARPSKKIPPKLVRVLDKLSPKQKEKLLQLLKK